MFTDMVGYTAITQKDETFAMKLLEEHRALVRPFFPKHGGKEVKTIGDAFLVEFGSALEAVRCAYDMQQSLHELNDTRPAEKMILLRIGVHLGDVIHSQSDVYGDAVNVASRIEPIATPGGICISGEVHRQIKNKLEFPLVSLGRKELKNVGETVEVFKVVLPWEAREVANQGLDRYRVAVLPFANMSPDPNDEYFADGMTEEMISTLSSISGLTVISRTSTMQYKGAKKSLTEIGRELGAGTLLEGSIRKSGNRARITVQLLDAKEDRHIWAQSYDRDLQDIFAVQSDVASNIAASLKVRLLEVEESQIRKKPTEDTQAFLLYLQGRQLWSLRTEESVQKALGCFNEAIGKDPSFAVAYAGIADCWNVAESWGYSDTSEAVPKIKEAALKALKMDSKLAEAHTAYAMILGWHEWRWDEAELEFERAIELNPSYSTAHQWYAWSVLRMKRRLDEELREARKALELDPLAPIMHHNIGQTYYYREEYDEAVKHFKRGIELNRALASVDYYRIASCYFAKSRYDEGIELLEKNLSGSESEKQKKQVKLNLSCFCGLAGRMEDANRLYEEAEKIQVRTAPINYVWAHFGMNHPDRMFEYLGEAMIDKEQDGPFALIDPLILNRYRSDPRLLDLLKRLGLDQTP